MVKIWSFSVLFKSKLSSELNLIFMKSFPYSPGLSFVFSTELNSILSLILPQSFLCFVYPFFLFVKQKIKHLFIYLIFNAFICFFSNYVQRVSNVNFYIIIRIFLCEINISKYVVNINVSVWVFVYFSRLESKSLILIISSKK